MSTLPQRRRQNLTGKQLPPAETSGQSSEPLMTTRDAATYLKMSESTLYHWATDGRIPCLKVGGALRFRRSVIDAWLAGKVQKKQVN